MIKFDLHGLRSINLKQRRKIFLVLGAVILIIVILMGLRYYENRRDMESEQEEGEAQLYFDGEWYKRNPNVKTVLLLGTDKFENTALMDEDVYINQKQADFLVLLVFDTKKETVSAIQINRDTMTPIRKIGATGDNLGSYTAQICLSHAYGSGKMDSLHYTADAVSNLLYDVDIDQSVAVTMDAVPIVNDLVGGVTVTVLHDFNGENGIGDAGSVITLKGDQSLTYVRARSGLEANTNLDRMERQRQYMDELYKLMVSSAASDEKFMKRMVEGVMNYLTTDSTTEQLQVIGEKALKFQYLGLTPIEGEAVVGEKYMEFYPDENALTRLVVENFYQPVEDVKS